MSDGVGVDASVDPRGPNQGNMGNDHLSAAQRKADSKGERNDIVSTIETFFAIVLLSVIMIFSQGIRRVIFLVILGILVMAKFAGF